MKDFLQYRDELIKLYTISVPNNIEKAKIEILTFRSAPAFLGTKLAKLHFEDKTLILYSKISGVVNRVLVENDEIVTTGQVLFELRNTNIIRDKARTGMKPINKYIFRPSFFEPKKNSITAESLLFSIIKPS